MGTDELAVLAKMAGAFDRTALIALVTEHWTARGASLIAQGWSKQAEWEQDAQECFAMALSPASDRGWVTLVESIELSLSADDELESEVSAVFDDRYPIEWASTAEALARLAAAIADARALLSSRASGSGSPTLLLLPRARQPSSLSTRCALAPRWQTWRPPS